MGNLAYDNVIPFKPKNEAQECRVNDNASMGYIPLYRSVKKSSFGKDVYKRVLWDNLLIAATHKPRTVKFNGIAWKLQTGQSVCHVAALGADLCDPKGKPLDRNSVNRILNFFEQEGMITRAGNRFGTVITVVNYAQYNVNFGEQISEQSSEQSNEQLKASDTNALIDGCEQLNEQLNEQISEHRTNITKQTLNTNTTPNPLTGVVESVKVKTKKPKAQPVPCQAVLEAYNAVVGNRLPNAEVLSDKRKRAIKKLLSELKTPSVEAATAYFKAFLALARPFHFGDNDRGWQATFDYVIRVDTLTSVREETL